MTPLRINRADVARMHAATRAARFENVPNRPDVAAAVAVLKIYFGCWVEPRIDGAKNHVLGIAQQRWSRNDSARDAKRLRVSNLDVSLLREALSSARFERADDSEEFVAAANLLREFITTEIIEPLVATLEHITGRIGAFAPRPD